MSMCYSTACAAEFDRLEARSEQYRLQLSSLYAYCYAMEKALKLSYDAMRAPLDEWKGVVERKALDAINGIPINNMVNSIGTGIVKLD
jgi:hypothetical protein